MSAIGSIHSALIGDFSQDIFENSSLDAVNHRSLKRSYAQI